MYEVPEALILEQVQAQMRDLGILPCGDTTLIADGKLHRYNIDGDKRGSLNGAYRIHTDGLPAWYLCDWRRGIEVTGHFDSSVLTGSELGAFNERFSDKKYLEYVERVRYEQEAEQRKIQREAITNAKKLYEQANSASLKHEYIKRKGIIDISDFRLGEKGELLIPLFDAKTQEFRSVQKIYPDGAKRFFKDAKTGGACYTFRPEKTNERLHFICEGIATGAAIFGIISKQWQVTCAMYCHNLLDVTKALREKYPRTTFIVCADNDLSTYAKNGNNAGRSCAEIVVKCGYAAGIIIPNFKENENGSDWDDYKALNGFDKAREEFNRQLDILLSEPANSESDVESADVHADISETGKIGLSSAEYEPPMNGFSYIDSGMLKADLERFGKYPEIYSGFENFDNAQGGFVPGLYVLGATPSLGKTTFMVQIADNIAKSGNFVMYFSLEQSRLELTTKSLSRLTAQRNSKLAVSSINIRRGSYINGAQHELFSQAIADYQEYSRNIAIIELGLDATISTITGAVQNFMNYTGLKPVVMVDYLQIIQPDSDKFSTKEAVDTVVRALKKLQVDNNLVVMVISSFNRTNYLIPVDYESFKESGNIEYTCDVLLGLQPQIITSSTFDAENKAKAKEKREAFDKAVRAIPRKIMLKNLKNRFGRKGYTCGFLYDARFDLFVPDAAYKEAGDE